MPAPARRRDRAWRPASENLRGRKPRGGWPRVRPGARYGDLAWRRSPRRRSAAGLDAARRGSNGCRAGKLAVPRGRPHALGRVGEPRSGSRARASPLRLDASGLRLSKGARDLRRASPPARVSAAEARASGAGPSYAPRWKPGSPFRGVGIGRETGVALGSDLTCSRLHRVPTTRLRSESPMAPDCASRRWPPSRWATSTAPAC